MPKLVVKVMFISYVHRFIYNICVLLCFEKKDFVINQISILLDSAKEALLEALELARDLKDIKLQGMYVVSKQIVIYKTLKSLCVCSANMTLGVISSLQRGRATASYKNSVI
jgi:hypothetical protein